jgi:membrane dipeptidase
LRNNGWIRAALFPFQRFGNRSRCTSGHPNSFFLSRQGTMAAKKSMDRNLETAKPSLASRRLLVTNRATGGNSPARIRLTNGSGPLDNRMTTLCKNKRDQMRNLRCAAVALGMAFACAGSLLAAPRTPAQAEKIAEKVLAHAIIIDTHADTPQMMLDDGYDVADPNSPYMISIPKMRQGHMGAEFMSIWVDVDWPRQDLVHRALDLIDAVNAQVALHSNSLELARTAGDIERIHARGKIAFLMGLEGGHIIEDDPRMLDIFYKLGVRYMTLTHTKNTGWAGSSGDQDPSKGLNDFGRQIVARMNRLGMMVDISHVSDKTFYDAVAASRAPVIASHSSCRALCPAPRDMTDDMIRALAKNGGVIDINYYPPFLDPDFARARHQVSGRIDAAVNAEKERLAKEGKHMSYARETAIDHKYEAGIPLPDYTRIVDHIDHAVKVGGIDHVGLGSDFDGVDCIPRGMEDASKIPNLVREMARRGYSAEDIEKVMGGNVLRVMRQVEEVAKTIQSEGGK